MRRAGIALALSSLVAVGGSPDAPAPVREYGAGELSVPHGLALVGDSLLVADTGHHRLVRLGLGGDPASAIAGSGEPGFDGDGGPASSARLCLPEGVAVDAAGVVYIADTFNSRIRRVAGDGRISTFAGGDDVGDGGPLRQADLSLLGSLDVEDDTLYIADTGHHRIRAVDLRRGHIRTVAGTGAPGFSGDGGPARAARFFRPEFVVADGRGGLYVADTFNHRIRRIDLRGRVSTVAGTGHPGYNGDGIRATAADLFSPEGMAVDREGHLYIADMGNDRIRRVDAHTGIISTAAGTGEPGFNGDGRRGPETQLSFPLALAYDRRGEALLLSDLFNHRVRRLDLRTGRVSTVAGSGEPGDAGEGGPATRARLFNPEGILLDPEGNLFIADQSNHRVRRVDARTGLLTTVAGTGAPGLSGDGGPGTRATLFSPSRLALHGSTLFIAETTNHRVRSLDLKTGLLHTAVGGGVGPHRGPASRLRLALPSGIAIRGETLYVADSGHHRVLAISTRTGESETLAGTGEVGTDGDGGPARRARLALPQTVTPDGESGLWITDFGSNRVRRVDSRTGRISTAVRSGMDGFDPGAPLEVAARSVLADAAAEPGGGLLVVDQGNGRVRRVAPGGRGAWTLAGEPGLVPEERPPAYAIPLLQPRRLLVADGAVFVSETGAGRVLRLPIRRAATAP